jgi:hypothetical protein
MRSPVLQTRLNDRMECCVVGQDVLWGAERGVSLQLNDSSGGSFHIAAPPASQVRMNDALP